MLYQTVENQRQRKQPERSQMKEINLWHERVKSSTDLHPSETGENYFKKQLHKASGIGPKRKQQTKKHLCKKSMKAQ